MSEKDRSRVARGRWGEARAVAHLRRLGYEIIDRNWRSPEPGVRGELDIIARRDDVLVIVEVKARRSAAYGGAVRAVDPSKQARIRELAASWVRSVDVEPQSVRFDVIAIDGVQLSHWDAAF